MADNDRDDFEEQIERMRAEGIAFPVSESELIKSWRRTPPVETTPAFDARIDALIEAARERRASLDSAGRVLADWRNTVGLSVRELAIRLRRNEDLVSALEADRAYPETLDLTFWQGYARELCRPVGEIADLIESYDRSVVVIVGAAAARSTEAMRSEERSKFLVDASTEQQLDEKRRMLVAGLRASA